MTTTVKNKKAAAGVGIAAVAAAALALGAGTYAGFIDTADGPDQTVATGTVFFDDSVVNTVVVEKLAPGGPAKTQTLRYRNGGNQAGGFGFDFNLTAQSESSAETASEVDPNCAGGANGPEKVADPTCGSLNDPGELDDQTTVVVTVSSSDRTGTTQLYSGSIAGLDSGVFAAYTAPSKADVTVTLTFTLPDIETATTNNNAAQGDSFVLDSIATLERPFDS